MNAKLTCGEKYTWTTMTLIGWTDGDGTGHDGYAVADYFGPDGVYLGPDQHGIEPILSA